MRPTQRWMLLGAFGSLLSLGCQGNINVPGGDTPDTEVLDEIGESGIRRLSAAEYNATVLDLLGVSVDSELVLPEDIRRPFDNEYVTQKSSEALVNSASVLAGNITTQVLTDTGLRDRIMPCEPSSASDEECFRKFLSEFGRKALRRTLSDTEVDRFATLFSHAEDESDFWVAVDSALRVFLQHPEFLHRIEIGSAVTGQDGVYRLTDFELATRISYLLLGSTPPPWLLDAAESGELKTPEGVRTNTLKLFETPNARERIARFHGMWLGFEKLPHAPELAADLELETTALINKVIFDDNGPWLDMLRSTETFLTPTLAQHYELPAPTGESGWVPYGSTGRQGLLSQGSFLSAVSKFGDTSPTQRGLLIRRALFCETIYLPAPDLNVNVDEPPETEDPNACKIERYNMWKTPGCESCHESIDPVGFGLENYDSAGRFRAFQPERPDCPIDGKGTLAGVGEFSGPAELSNLVAENPDINACIATQMYRFTMGRSELKAEDNRILTRLVESASVEGELHLKTLIVELVASDAFRFRREEAAQ